MHLSLHHVDQGDLINTLFDLFLVEDHEGVSVGQWFLLHALLPLIHSLSVRPNFSIIFQHIGKQGFGRHGHNYRTFITMKFCEERQGSTMIQMKVSYETQINSRLPCCIGWYFLHYMYMMNLEIREPTMIMMSHMQTTIQHYSLVLDVDDDTTSSHLLSSTQWIYFDWHLYEYTINMLNTILQTNSILFNSFSWTTLLFLRTYSHISEFNSTP